MRYIRCIHFDEGHCYNQGLRNGLPSLGCVGYDRCDHYTIEQPLNRSDKTQSEPHKEGHSKLSRQDIVGQNGNDGEVYKVEKIARAIAGDRAEQQLGEGKLGWTLFIPNAIRVMEVIEDA